MRHVGAILGLAVLAALSGCASTRWNFLNPDKAANVKPTGPAAPALPAASYVAYLNDNAGRVQSVQVSDLVVTCKMGLKSIDVMGKMVTEKPRNFRMKATVFGSDAVDLGSNSDEFWFWISKNEPPYQFYCPYKDLAERPIPHLPMPFQPEWVMEAMGLGPYGPADKYTVEADADTVRLVEKARSPQGQAVRKVIVMKRHEVRPPHPQVVAYLLVDDATGKEIVSAHILDVTVDRPTGAIVPRRLELRWPAQRTTLTLNMSGTVINAQVPPTAFVRQQLNGVPSFNLARGQLDATGTSIQRARGTSAP